MAEENQGVDPDQGQPTGYDDTAPPDEGLAPNPKDIPPGRKKGGSKEPPRGAAPVDTQGVFQREQTPSVGRIVHFMIPSAMHGGTARIHRPAVISNVRNAKKGIVDLHVFVTRDDYPNNYHPGPVLVADKVGYSDTEEDGTWHWPERV